MEIDIAEAIGLEDSSYSIRHLIQLSNLCSRSLSILIAYIQSTGSVFEVLLCKLIAATLLYSREQKHAKAAVVLPDIQVIAPNPRL